VARSGDNTLATLQLTMADESSLTAVVLGSMVVVSGISYQPASAGTHPTVQHRMTAYARSGGNPDIGFSGRETPVVLAVDSPIDNNALLLPGTVYTKDLVVVVPGSGIAALQVAIMVDYARQTRLVLGHAALLKHPVRAAQLCHRSPSPVLIPVRAAGQPVHRPDDRRLGAARAGRRGKSPARALRTLPQRPLRDIRAGVAGGRGSGIPPVSGGGSAAGPGVV
jgi:hypothetical protein